MPIVTKSAIVFSSLAQRLNVSVGEASGAPGVGLIVTVISVLGPSQILDVSLT